MKTYTKKVTRTEPRLVITNDDNAESPREWSNLGYFITVDRNYNSPDRNEQLENIVRVAGQEAQNTEDHMQLISNLISTETGEIVEAIYPVTKYEHSGIAYSLGIAHGFDNSNNGFYIVTDKTAKDIGAKPKDYEKIIKSELEVFNKYANGGCYEFTLYDEDGELVDSCGGFYDIEDIREHLPKEWENENLSDYYKD